MLETKRATKSIAEALLGQIYASPTILEQRMFEQNFLEQNLRF